MNQETVLTKILRSNNTIFTFSEVFLLNKGISEKTLRQQLSYYVKNKKLIRLRRGIYSKDADFDKYELATKIYKPAYISFETVLRDNGMIFQYYETIFVASTVTRLIQVGNIKIQYYKMKDSWLLEKKGQKSEGNFTVASPERAYVDACIRDKRDIYLDNRHKLDQNVINNLKTIYAKQ